MTDTSEELKQHCEELAYILDKLAYGMYYDTETCDVVNDIPEDCEDENRYQDLIEYVFDEEYGIKITTSLDGKDLYGAEICMAWGGPNVYINTRDAYIEGYWGSTEVKRPFSYNARDQINDYIDEDRGC